MNKGTGEESYNRLIPTVVSRGHACLFDFLMATAKEEAKQLVELYPSLPTEKMTVRYALKPLSENPEIFQVPASEFCAIAGLSKEFLWTNSIYLPSNVKVFLQNNPIQGIDSARELEDKTRSKQLKAIYADQGLTAKQEAPFVICKIDDVVGWGVFTSKDLPENSFVCVYSGKVQTNTSASENLKQDHFRMELRHKVFDGSPVKESVEVGCISASEMGNLTRFLNAMPTREQLQDFDCQPESAKEDTAIANCTYQHGMLDAVPAQFIVTKRAIKRNEQLSIPYWGLQNNFGLFHKTTGKLMPNVRLVSKIKADNVNVAFKLYIPTLDKEMAFVLERKSFIIALLRNHLSGPQIPGVKLLHADYIRYLASRMDQAELKKICGDKWPPVQFLQQEFIRDEKKMVPAIIESLSNATFQQWRVSTSENYHHFELRVALEQAERLRDCFVRAHLGFVYLKQDKEVAVLHWHEDPFQNLPSLLKTLQIMVVNSSESHRASSTLTSK